MNIVVATRREGKAWSSGRSGSAHPDERCENRAEPRRHVLIMLLAGMVWPAFPHRTGGCFAQLWRPSSFRWLL